FVAGNDDIRGAAVAAIMEQHTVASRRHLLGERQDAAKIAAATRRKCHPRTMLTKDLVVDVHTSYVGYGHRSSSCLMRGIGDRSRMWRSCYCCGCLSIEGEVTPTRF